MPSAKKHAFWNPVRDLGHPLVKVRHARLDAHRHARLVDLHDVVVRQLIARLEQSNRIETITIDGVQIVSHQGAKGAKVTAITPAAVASIELEQPPVGGSPRVARSEDVVTAEKLVGALAYQDDLDAALAALAVQQPCGDRAPVGEKIVEARDRGFEVVRHLLRSDDDLFMLRADVTRNAARLRTLVELGMGKAHGEGAHLRAGGRQARR